MEMVFVENMHSEIITNHVPSVHNIDDINESPFLRKIVFVIRQLRYASALFISVYAEPLKKLLEMCMNDRTHLMIKRMNVIIGSVRSFPCGKCCGCLHSRLPLQLEIHRRHHHLRPTTTTTSSSTTAFPTNITTTDTFLTTKTTKTTTFTTPTVTTSNSRSPTATTTTAVYN